VAVIARPLGVDAAQIAGAYVPPVGEEHRRPRPPWLRRIVESETAVETGVGAIDGELLPHQVTFQARHVVDGGAAALSLVGEDGAEIADVR